MRLIQKIFLILLILSSFTLKAQNNGKKVLDYSNFSDWNQISSRQISNNGLWVSYVISPIMGDPKLVLYSADKNTQEVFARGDKPKFSADNQQLIFWLKPPVDSLNHQRRKKVKKELLPKDTLCIYHLSEGRIEKISDVQSYQLPDEWSGWLAYQLVPDKNRVIQRDTTIKRQKKESKKTGSRLVIKSLKDSTKVQFEFVKYYSFAKKSPKFLIHSTGINQDPSSSGVYAFSSNPMEVDTLHQGAAEYQQFAITSSGDQVAFLANLDTTEVKPEPFKLFYTNFADSKVATEIANSESTFLPDSWIISQHGKLTFSENQKRLFFGIAPPPILQDTNILKEEIVNVEVWTYQDPILYPQQNVRLQRDQKKSYPCVYDPTNNSFIQIGNVDLPEVRLSDEGNGDFALGFHQESYLKESSWEGWPVKQDVFLVNIKTGEHKLIAKALKGRPEFSPHGKYVYWYSTPDSAWYTYSVQEGWTRSLTQNIGTAFYDEMNDQPDLPSSYGIAGWTTNDDFIIINDRYDLWLIDPTLNLKANNMTLGRKDQVRYRYIKTDPTKRSIEEVAPFTLHYFDEKTKEEGYVQYDLHTTIKKKLISGDFRFNRSPLKSKDADRWVFTKENFSTFPNLYYSKGLTSEIQISDANPQQQDYRWGTIEPYQWTSLDGQSLTGLLVKPEGFDPNKQYPLIVNFYERSSDGLHRHRAPFPGRSTISYSFYASRGYIIFNPDVPYKIGYPGESAYNAVVSGATALVNEGFVDKENIALQGHSWGGYQIAYLLTRTNMFKCAESGAPVVNMISAYGGIRWGTGLSRMFQYEKTQSRIGGSLWETPLRYIENSPIFTIDKINTPVLILHNDKDGAVPWYQGIEFFVAMRRLGKPAWMLNYNGEPHWPVKLQNRIDFQTRMSQFFDHYLQQAPMPKWMKKGVPAIEKGIRQGIRDQ